MASFKLSLGFKKILATVPILLGAWLLLFGILGFTPVNVSLVAGIVFCFLPALLFLPSKALHPKFPGEGLATVALFTFFAYVTVVAAAFITRS